MKHCPVSLCGVGFYKTGLFIFFIFFIPAACFAQLTITGRVLNRDNNKPVENASVFLSNATVGDKTAADGTFTLQHVKPGKYSLIVSFVGFEQYSQVIIAAGGNLTLQDIEISPKAIALAEVKVKPDPNRARNYDMFLREFLGPSYFAKDCKLLNPEILNLNYDDATATLTASSDDFLVFENA